MADPCRSKADPRWWVGQALVTALSGGGMQASLEVRVEVWMQALFGVRVEAGMRALLGVRVW